MTAHWQADPLVTELASFPVATVYEAAGKIGDMSPEIRPLVDGVRLAGRAFTVRALAGDNLAVFRAIHEAPAGVVLVIDAGDTDRATIWGGSSTLACVAKGIAGCVTNAATRDIDEIRASRFPLYAAGLNIRGVVRSHPGWLQSPVSVGGAIVNPGDIILGDSDGVVVVAAEQASAVAVACRARRRTEEARDARLRTGEAITTVLGINN